MMIINMNFYTRVFQAPGKISDPPGLAGINKNEFRDLIERYLLLTLEIRKKMA